MKKAQAISVYCYYISLTKYLASVREKIKGKAERYGALAARAMQDLEQTLRDLEA